MNMKRLIGWFIATLWVLPMLCAAAKPGVIQTHLREGLFQEEVKRDYSAAITEYEQIASVFD
jgi:hypothetical protein